MTSLPSLFLAHGAPDLPIVDHPARSFLEGLSTIVPAPKAILIVSAHWELPKLALTAADAPRTIHDFAGFPRALYDLTYPARTDTGIIHQIREHLSGAGIAVEEDRTRGYDHGAWVPLMLAYPAATIPVIQMALVSGQDPAFHFRLGERLSGLRRQGILIVGSGSIVHNLRAIGPEGSTAPDWADHFDDWVARNIADGNLDALLRFPIEPESARLAHPTPEHFLPLFVAMGAGWQGGRRDRIHHSFSYGSISMACYAFGDA